MSKVERTWVLRPRSARVRVSTVHPQVGALYRGTIYGRGTAEGARGRWEIVNYDHVLLDPVVGDYLDAEAALLAATAGLDEVEPDADRPPACPNCGNGMFHNGLPEEPYWCGACGMRVARNLDQKTGRG